MLRFMLFPFVLLSWSTCALSLPVLEDPVLVPRHLAVSRTDSIKQDNVFSVTGTSVAILFQNNLNSSSTSQHISAFLTGSVTSSAGSSLCSSLSESPLPYDDISAHEDDFLAQFNWLCYTGRLSCPQAVWVDGGVVQVEADASYVSLLSASKYTDKSLPQLCTQSDTGDLNAQSSASPTNQVAVTDDNGNTYTGYHNKKAFRFLGIPYTNSPARFEYSKVNSAANQNFDATQTGAECLQSGASSSASEDCLFMNFYTTYLPNSGNKNNLLPVVLYIHGGAFISGTGNSVNGDNLASREGVVAVSINYRLGTYGFMAASGCSLNGNYAVSDWVSALDWTIANIASFGGDPTQITIMGQSAGAAAVRVLLGSKKAIGKYQGAIVMSNLGGGADMGLGFDYGTSNSEYYTIAGSQQLAGNDVFEAAGCTQSSVAAKAACLKAYDGDLTSLVVSSRYVVQDGTYVTTAQLEAGRPGSVAEVPVMMGNVKNDGASFTGYSTSCTTEESCLVANLGVSSNWAGQILSSGLFPMYETGNMALDAFNLSQLIYTANTFVCVDQATAYAGATTGAFTDVFYYRVMRAYGGYNPNNVDSVGPIVAGYPLGDPTLPYFRLHSGEVAFAMGVQTTLRDEQDADYQQVTTAYFGSMIRTGNPNPDLQLLEARGYSTARSIIQAAGTWSSVKNGNGPIMELDAQPWQQEDLNVVDQCDWLNYTLDYYL